MKPTTASISRPTIATLLMGAVLLLGLAVAFTALAGNASAGGDTKITVNSTANIDDGECEGAPNDDEIGNCTLQEAINMVNNGDADIINFHKPVFSKEQPGIILLCTGEGELPAFTHDVVIDSKNTGVILDGGSKEDEEDCNDEKKTGLKPDFGLWAEDFDNGFDFELNGGKNFTIRNIDGIGIGICSLCGDDASLGTIEITGVIIENIGCEGILIAGSNLESGSITNSEISSNGCDGVAVFINACVGDDCELTDSVIDISGNRIEGGAEGDGAGSVSGGSCECSPGDAVNVFYRGALNADFSAGSTEAGNKITANISQNEVLNGFQHGVRYEFVGCGVDSGVNVAVDENLDINGENEEAVHVIVSADGCAFMGGALAGLDVVETSTGFVANVTVNRNGDMENHSNDEDGVDVDIAVCCNQSDSSASVEVNDNGRITGEDDGVDIFTYVCCGDDNSTDVSVSSNDEITGESADGIDVVSFAGSDSTAVSGSVAGGTGFDGDDNICNITVDGNNEVDGVGNHGMDLTCVAGTWGDAEIFSLPICDVEDGGCEKLPSGGAFLSSGDENVASIVVSNNDDIDGDDNGVYALAAAGSVDGEADDNFASVRVTDNGETTGDDGHGVQATVLAGSMVEEGDDNATEIVITGNEETGGNGGDGLLLISESGGLTAGSEDNSTSVLVDQNGAIEGSGGNENDEGTDGGDGIDVNSKVCCDEANTNTVTITNNKDEITGHDGDGIDIGGPASFGIPFDGLCCSVNIITIMDNAGNIRGGDDDGLELSVCITQGISGESGPFGLPEVGLAQALPIPFPFGAGEDCMSHSVTQLTVINNSFSDSERDGIAICCGAFQLEEFGIKSVISNNVIEGNGDDGIDIESSIGLNIGPGNEIFENGTNSNDNGIEIDWCLGLFVWAFTGTSKVPANSNTITQNSIYDNFGLGIDLVGFDADEEGSCADSLVEDEGTVGCVPFPLTAISPNDCIPFPELQTQSGDKLIGIACSECTVEVFWADNDPANNDDAFGDAHGEGAVYLVSGEAEEDGSFSIDLPCDLDGGDLTATATDKLKNTSEFAENLVTLGTGSCATDTPVPSDTPVPTDTPAVTDTPVPTDPPVPTNTPVPEKVCGDVNEDGVANSVDASLVLQFKAGLISSLPNESSGDVNSDGALTSVDAALLLQFTAGLIGEDGLNCG